MKKKILLWGVVFKVKTLLLYSVFCLLFDIGLLIIFPMDLLLYIMSKVIKVILVIVIIFRILEYLENKGYIKIHYKKLINKFKSK